MPDELSLGVEEMEETYARAQVNLDFHRFASVKPEFRGERIGYGITIPSNARHAQEAAQFIAFLLGPEGRAVRTFEYFRHIQLVSILLWAPCHPVPGISRSAG